MTPYYDDGIARIWHTDALTCLRQLEDESVNCCVTSPPYYGLRNYGVEGQLGLERTYQEYVEKLVAVFAELRRVLAEDGTVWLNLGDSYNGGNKGNSGHMKDCYKQSTNVGSLDTRRRDSGTLSPARNGACTDLKIKDLIGIPWRVAFALQADGWYLRQDIIWAKPNPMPESVQDRCTKAHEYLFLLTKNERYFFDNAAIQEPAETNDLRRPYTSEGAWQLDGRPPEQRHGGEQRDSWKGSEFHTGKTADHQLGRASKNRTHKYTAEYEASDTEEHRTKAGLLKISDIAYPTRNRRSVWTIPTQPYPDAHFATFPEDLVKPCILAGCPPGGTVCDLFSGSGTVALVAKQNGCKFVGCDINADYIDMAAKRLSQAVFSFA